MAIKREYFEPSGLRYLYYCEGHVLENVTAYNSCIHLVYILQEARASLESIHFLSANISWLTIIL